MKSNQGLKNKIILSGIVFSLAIINTIFLKIGNEGIDSTFILLITLAVIIVLLPWENLTSLKAAGIELTLDKPQVKGALNSLKMDHRGKQLLEKKLSDLASEIEQIDHSRILWVDDKPQVIVGERRLLRSLGIEVVTAKDTESALRKIEEDNDFDIIISDVQRIGLGGIRKEMAIPKFEMKYDYKEYLKDGDVDIKLRKVFEEQQPLTDTARIFKKDEKHWHLINYKEDYLFSLDEISGNDSEKLIEFLKQKFGIDWVKKAKIEKIDYCKTIRVTAGKNFLSLRLNNEGTKKNKEIDDGRIDELIVKKDNGRLNIYKVNYKNVENTYILEDNGKQLKIYDGTILDGWFFVSNLRKSEDPIIKNIPVILYTGYTYDVLKEKLNGEEQLPNVEISMSIDNLLELVILNLYEVRSNPIKVSPTKKPTPLS